MRRDEIPAWPAFVALSLVVVLAIIGVGLDLFVDYETPSNDLDIDALTGAATTALAAVVACVLLRMLRQQRRLVAARMAELGERQRELEAFAGRVAHDLRGPLSPLAGYADMIAVGGGPPPRELGRRMGRCVDQLAGIIDSLLALSTSGAPLPGTTAVAPVITEVLDELRPSLADAQLELAVADCQVRCAAYVLGQIVRNLVTNAIKYRAVGRALAIEISASANDGAVELAIADNGIGMDAETCTHVFEPLYRASDVHRIPGSGLGLAIVKRLADALGGTATVTSERDHGTRFAVRLPAVT